MYSKIDLNEFDVIAKYLKNKCFKRGKNMFS